MSCAHTRIIVAKRTTMERKPWILMDYLSGPQAIIRDSDVNGSQHIRPPSMRFFLAYGFAGGFKMSCTTLIRLIGLLLTSGIVGCHRVPPQDLPSPNDDQRPAQQDFRGLQAGEQREVAGIPLCWCPAGKFLMGSPPDEPERRPGEDQVEVILTKGFWMAKYETTQGQWKQVIGQLPGELTAELPEGDDYPLGNVNFAEAEA